MCSNSIIDHFLFDLRQFVLNYIKAANILWPKNASFCNKEIIQNAIQFHWMMISQKVHCVLLQHCQTTHKNGNLKREGNSDNEISVKNKLRLNAVTLASY